MSVVTRVVASLAKLPRAQTYDIEVVTGLKARMADGVELLADRYRPAGFTRGPVVLIRSPYGRRGPLGSVLARLIAERGFQVVLQSVRGTFGSGGEFDPFVNEGSDGAATVEWLRTQSWYDGTLATFGPSYLGIVQWALAPAAGAELKAMAMQITASQFRDQTYTGETFSLATALIWSYLISFQEQGGILVKLAERKRVARGVMHLPLSEADRMTVGANRAFYQDWLRNNQPGSAFWAARDYSDAVSDVTAAVNMVSGWYDIFLPWMLADYQRLRAAGRSPHLTIGPWAHTDPKCFATGLRESLTWFRAELLGQRDAVRTSPVRIFVMGANEWRDLPDWPPATQPRRWHLHAGKALATAAPRASQPDRYRYDPNDPTPSIGGVWLGPGSGVADNRKLEKRADVLTYTSAVLENEVEIIGEVSAELFVRSTLPDTDFFVRLCDVRPEGRSMNICDGILRVRAGIGERQADGSLRIVVTLWPTAYRFKRSHRIRLQVSSGAHPRFARNPGSGEPLATARKMWVADQSIYHDPAHPSAVVLPISAKR